MKSVYILLVALSLTIAAAAVYAADGGSLTPLDIARCRERAAHLLETRGLPRRHGDEAPGGYSSPACYAHEFPGYFGEPDER